MSDDGFRPYQQLLGSFSQRTTSLEVFSRRRKHVWTFSVLGDCICELKRVTRVRTAVDQNPSSFLMYFNHL